MKINKFAGAFAATVLALSVTACGGDSAPAETKAPAPAETSAAAPAETTPAADDAAALVEDEVTEPASDDSDQSVEDACLELTNHLLGANLVIAQAAEQATTDPQGSVDMWTSLVDAAGEAADNITNPDLKAATVALHEGVAEVRDHLQKVVDEDYSALAEYAEALEEMTAAYENLNDACS